MKVLITLLAYLFSLNVFAVEAIHGMVLFGKEKVYAYHLPMFHKVHNKQMVLTFDLSKEAKDQIVNLQDTTFLTFVPAPFDLEKFIAAPFNLTGDVYSGHFEQDGKLVMSGVTLVNPKIEYFQELIQPNGSSISMFKVFGTKNDAYALYLINGGSPVDQIFKLTTTYAGDYDLEAATKIYHLFNVKLNGEYELQTPGGKCPGRNCGSPGNVIASFTATSLYFTDIIMGAKTHNHPEVLAKSFCKTRLCEP